MQNTESPAQGAFTKVPTETQKAEARPCPFVYIIPKPEQMDSERGFFFFFFFFFKKKKKKKRFLA